jgi:hypothetical protein
MPNPRDADPMEDSVSICNTQLVRLYEKPWRDKRWSPANGAAFARDWFAGADRERYGALAILPDETFDLATNLSYGSGNITLLRVQEILRTFGHLQHPRMAHSIVRAMELVVNTPANRIVLIHNHPDGRREPSRFDKVSTGIIQAAALFMGIELVDHLILVGLFEDEGFVSMREAGYLDEPVNLMGMLQERMEARYPRQGNSSGSSRGAHRRPSSAADGEAAMR